MIRSHNSVPLRYAFPNLDSDNPTATLRQSMFSGGCILSLTPFQSSITGGRYLTVQLRRRVDFVWYSSDNVGVMESVCNKITTLAELDKLLYEKVWLGDYGLRSDIMRGMSDGSV